MYMLKSICVLAILAGCSAVAAPIPTFAQLDSELHTYKPKAHLEGETNSHLQTDDLAFYCLFDLFLTVLNDPGHPKYAETRKAWDKNYDTFQEQAGFITHFMGKNLLPLLISTSAQYAREFKEGAKLYAPRFRPEDYIIPLPTEVGCAGKTDRVAWWHGGADADGDKTSNAEELLAVAPGWRMQGVTKEVRARFIGEALGSGGGPAIAPYVKTSAVKHATMEKQR